MARVQIHQQDSVSDPDILNMFAWVTQMEGKVPNHFLVELNFPEFMKAKLAATKILWELGELTPEQIQHIGILVSRANGCEYCTGAFCTILSHGLDASQVYVNELVDKGVEAIEEQRLRLILDFALKVNEDPKVISDADVEAIKDAGYTDKGIIQIVHLVSDFASYNKLNLALDTDYDYESFGSK